MPTAQMSQLNVSNSGKKSDGCKLVNEIIFDDINIIGPLINVHATILLAIKSTSVSYLVAMTKAPGAIEIERREEENESKIYINRNDILNGIKWCLMFFFGWEGALLKHRYNMLKTINN